jgi:hypothetical protein
MTKPEAIAFQKIIYLFVKANDISSFYVTFIKVDFLF